MGVGQCFLSLANRGDLSAVGENEFSVAAE